MRSSIFFFKLIFTFWFWFLISFSSKADTPVMWLSFDEINVNEELHFRTVEDKITKRLDTIVGNYTVLKDGVYGKSLLLDGYSAFLFSKSTPALSGSFSVEGWVALGAYPYNFCPLAEQIALKDDKGFSLGINYKGKPVFKIFTHNGLVSVEGKNKIPILTWAHISGVYDQRNIKLYINGEKVAHEEVRSAFVPANDEVFYSGITSQKLMPEGQLGFGGTKPVYHFFDGLIDELKIWDRALTEKDFETVQNKVTNLNAPDLKKRSLPELAELDNFGAFYTDLKFYESWDNFWRTTHFPDVVVSFGKSAGHFVFWRGTNYIPHWVTENGIWYNDEFNETWSEFGCHEPMSDKRNQYSHVRIIENTPARSVVHWRYALNDNWYRISNVDSLTGWGDWSDEIYTIYPDGVAVRSQTLHSSNLKDFFEWHEGIVIMGQGQRPEDVLYPEALIMANMNGDKHIYSWDIADPGSQKEGITYIRNKKDKWLTELPGSNIQLINTRSSLKPFTIVDSDSEPTWDIYWYFEFDGDVSIFPWWNHWPTSFQHSDGINTVHSTRASHSSLTHLNNWKPYKKTEYSETRLMLVGLTKEDAPDLVSLAQSWSNAPEISVTGNNNIINQGYDPAERAYHLECSYSGECNTFSIQLNCSPDFPALNPAFVISNWNNKNVEISINGEIIKNSNIVRYGISPTANGPKLIFWISKEFDKPVIIKVSGK